MLFPLSLKANRYKSKDVKVAPKILKTYEGKYEVGPGMSVIITAEGDRLFGEPSGQPKVEFFPLSANKFYIKEEDVRVIFNKNDQQKVDTITVFINGQEMKGKKVE